MNKWQNNALKRNWSPNKSSGLGLRMKKSLHNAKMFSSQNLHSRGSFCLWRTFFKVGPAYFNVENPTVKVHCGHDYAPLL